MLFRISAVLACVALIVSCESAAWAVSYELRGVGILPSFGTPPAGVAGENITVSVMLDSDDFDYYPVANEIFHYFVPNTTIPVNITGSISGAYPNVSPIGRFVALELTDDPGNSDDQIHLDVEFDNGSTSLLTVYADGVDGFNGDVTPFNSTELFTLFAEAMHNQAVWNRSNSAVFIGDSDHFLSLGDLDWSLIDPNEPPTQQINIEPTFDVQLKPGNAYPLGNATATTLDIDGGSGTSFPILDVLMDFPLNQIPAVATITSAKLKLDATTSSSSMTIHALGYAGDGLASLADEFATTSIVGSKPGPQSSTTDIVIDLNTDYIESLLEDDATHLGLRLKSATAGPFVRIATTENTTGTAPTLVLEYAVGLPGDFDFDGSVDGNDFLVWQRGGSAAPLSPSDLAAWQANFGVPAAAPAAAVPEPAAIVLAALAGLCLWGRRGSAS
jgi:hypothetical protein